MAYESLYVYIKRLETEIKSIIAVHASDDIDKMVANQLKAIKNELADVRLDVRDYEFAQSRTEQQGAKQEATKRLVHLRNAIASATQQGIFSAVDVARISAQLDHLIAGLE